MSQSKLHYGRFVANWGQSRGDTVTRHVKATIMTFSTNKCVTKTAVRVSDKFQLTSRSEQVDRNRRRGGCFILEVAVSVDAHCWQLHTISPRATDLLLCTMEPRAQWNLGVRPARRSSACSCARSRESSLPLQLATHFSFNNEKLVYYQLLWQSFRFKKKKKKIGVHFWGLLFIGVWSGSEKLFSPNCEAYLDLTNLPKTWMALHCLSLTHKMTCGLITVCSLLVITHLISNV